jgi:hypothetical protein
MELILYLALSLIYGLHIVPALADQLDSGSSLNRCLNCL